MLYQLTFFDSDIAVKLLDPFFLFRVPVIYRTGRRYMMGVKNARIHYHVKISEEKLPSCGNEHLSRCGTLKEPVLALCRWTQSVLLNMAK